MTPSSTQPVIHIDNLVRKYGKREAVNGLSLEVKPGQCYGFFGRNGAGKTTTIKCLLNLLRRDSGTLQVFGLDPERNEVEVKEQIAYVPDAVAFHPWMTVRDTLDYLASFRKQWNRGTERKLLQRFNLDPKQKSTLLSKGQKTQLALIGAVAAEPELLILDEPTSGLDPIVRREFIETVIGAYQEVDPEKRTIFVSTHLITEFEGLIDAFTIMDEGRAVYSADADDARSKYKKIRARFPGDPPTLTEPGILSVRREFRTLELIVNGNSDQVQARLRESSPEELVIEALSLEEIFVAQLQNRRNP